MRVAFCWERGRHRRFGLRREVPVPAARVQQSELNIPCIGAARAGGILIRSSLADECLPILLRLARSKAVSARENDMSGNGTIIVTGASQGIGAGVAQAFLDRGYNVVANSRKITNSGRFRLSDKLVLVDGNIGESTVAAKIVETAITRFGSIDALVNNAGIFFAKPFTEFTTKDFEELSTVNLKGFL